MKRRMLMLTVALLLSLVLCGFNVFAADGDLIVNGSVGIGGDMGIGGSVGIGTSTPAAKLDVAGQVKITGGTPGAGKVLTSDANGLATWQTPTGGGGTVNVYQMPGGQLTLSTTRTTTACGGGCYYDCIYNICGDGMVFPCLTTPQTCNNTYVGKLVP